MRVFQTKARQPHFRIAVRHVVVVGIRIEKEVGRIQDPDSAASAFHRRGDVEAVDEGFVTIVSSVAIGVLVNGDPISAFEMVRRRGRHPVIHRAPDAVAADHFQSRRPGILPILHHPQASAFIEIEKDGLGDLWFGQDLFPLQIVGDLEMRHRLLGTQGGSFGLLRQVQGRRWKSGRR